MDKHASLRTLPLLQVLGALGITTEWKTRKGGREWYGRCPLHQAKNNATSFSFEANGLFNCFSCGAKGRGAVDLVKAFKDCGFKEAVSFLEGLNGHLPAETPAVEPASALSGPLEPLSKDTWRKFAVPCPWLEKRIPDTKVRERYGVFCYNNPARRSAYSGRVMLPVKDVEGVLYGYLGRSTEDTKGTNADTETVSTAPKYLFPRNLPKSRFLFGAAELKAGPLPLPLKVVWVVESCFSVMHFASLGFPAVSPFGWSVSDDQIGILATLAKGVCYLPDRNKAQESAGVVHRLAQRLWVKAPALPDGVDDPEFLTETQLKAL